MLNLRDLRKDINSIAEKLTKKGFKLDTAQFNKLEQKRREQLQLCEQLQAKEPTSA